MNKITLFTKGLFYENPLLVLAMGLCPALAATATAKESVALGLATLAVLVLASVIISCLKSYIGEKAETAVIVIVVSGITSIVHLVMKAYFPEIEENLGIFLPLIAVNCIVLETLSFFARNHSVGETLLNSFGMGIGYLWALALLGTIREFLSLGTIWEETIYQATDTTHASVFGLLPGGLIILATLMALTNWIITKIKLRGNRIWR